MSPAVEEIGDILWYCALAAESTGVPLDVIAKNNISSFNKTKDDDKFCKANEKEPAKCADKVVLSHAGELIADQWGIKVTSIHAKAENYSFGESESMLTESWAKLCGTVTVLS